VSAGAVDARDGAAGAPPPAGSSHAPAPSGPRSLLLAAIAAAVIVAVILLASGGSSHSHRTGAKSSASTTTTTTPTVTARLPLTSPTRASKALGVVAVISEGTTRAFYIAAEHLAPSRGFFYALWLYNSPSSHQALSRAPNVGSDGRLAGGALLPANAASYHQILLTRETNERAPRPGPTVLRGPFTVQS
jgi:hypothetical protein